MVFGSNITLNLLDLLIIILISIISSILVTIIYSLIRNKKKIYINLSNINSIYFGKGKNGYLEKEKKFTDKTTYVEHNYILSISNNSNKPYTFRNIIITSRKSRRHRLEEGSLNLNGTAKSIVGATSYDKLKHLVIKPYECVDYDVNIRMSKEEFLKFKNVYLSYVGFKNKIKYVKVKAKR